MTTTQPTRCCPKCLSYRPLERRVVDDGHARLELDLCANCRGAWLDWDELGPAKSLRDLLPIRAANASVERDQKFGVCPACSPSYQLDRLVVGAFAIDRCPSCEGLWFDGGELGPMLTEQGFAALLQTLRANPATG